VGSVHYKVFLDDYACILFFASKSTAFEKSSGISFFDIKFRTPAFLAFKINGGGL